MTDSSSFSSTTTTTTSTSLPSFARPAQRTIPPFVLLPFAVIHSQVYWLYSIFYHLYNNLSERPLDLSLDETVLNALTKRSGRARAFSEPQQTSAYIQQSHIITHETCSTQISSTTNRPRSTTITASTVQADSPLRRQQWVQQVHSYYIHEQQNLLLNTTDYQSKTRLLQTSILDERLGRTQPPRWWKRTKRHLIRQEKLDNDQQQQQQQQDKVIFNSLTSTLSLPPIHTSMDSDIRTNQISSLHSPRLSCDLSTHHHDITTNNTTDNNNNNSYLNLSCLSTMETQNSLSAQMTMQQQRRSLAKIRSVFIKSQIEPENAPSEEQPKRKKSILGIPSPWSTPLSSPSSIESSDTLSIPKKRLFASLRKQKQVK